MSFTLKVQGPSNYNTPMNQGDDYYRAYLQKS